VQNTDLNVDASGPQTCNPKYQDLGGQLWAEIQSPNRFAEDQKIEDEILLGGTWYYCSPGFSEDD
jgi:hypothetical protein